MSAAASGMPSVNTAIGARTDAATTLSTRPRNFCAGSKRTISARMASTATYNQQQLVQEPEMREHEEAGISGIGGMAGGAPPNILAMPACQTKPISGVSSSQKMISGRAMRSARFAQNPPVPSFWCSRRAKYPAMKKNSDMRKMCETKAASPRNCAG